MLEPIRVNCSIDGIKSLENGLDVSDRYYWLLAGPIVLAAKVHQIIYDLLVW